MSSAATSRPPGFTHLPLVQADLDRLALDGCQHPDCDHSYECRHDPIYFLHPACHPSALQVQYKLLSGCLTLLCPVCKRVVCYIRVATEQGRGL